MSMPIYEYQCDACSHAHEALQKISDAPLSECPQCKAPALRKKISAAGFRLKGGGWYETDFKAGQKERCQRQRQRWIVRCDTRQHRACRCGTRSRL